MAAYEHLPDGAHQAGGGVSGRVHQVRVFKPHVLDHLKKVYGAYGKGSWSPEQTAVFLKTVQHDTPSELALELADDKDWEESTFLKYMTSSVTSAVAPPEEQDLSWPLSAYFISSSHNTYLTGNQLSSDSSADAYKNVLLRGCRCIEVDVWDGDEPDSDSDTSISSSDEEVATSKPKKRLSSVKDKLPSSLTSKLEKTSLGKKLDKRISTSPTNTAPRTTANTTPTTSTKPATKPPTPTSPPATKKDKKNKKIKTPYSPSKTDSTTDSSNTLVQTTTTESTGPTDPKIHRSPSLKEPRVYHGYTLTKEVSFREVCIAIRDYAFAVTDSPLIVSLEVHCSPEQQLTMVAIMNETWAGLLLPEPKEDATTLPAPGNLRGKILVKVKYTPPPSASSTILSGGDTPPENVDPAAAKPKKPSKIIHTLSKLGIYTRGVTFKTLQQPEATMPTHIFSLSEGGVSEVHSKSAKELFEHNRCYLMRAYPSGFRIRSSNLDPAVFWRKGIQVVALNWQNWDEGMMLNEGMFAGTEGYVLKPEGYRPNKPLPPTSPTTAPQAQAVTHYTMDLTITVLAGQDIPLPLGDTKVSGFRPYLKVEIHVEEPGERHGTTEAVPDDGKEKEGEYKAKTKSLKGIDPDWKGQELVFKGIPGVVPELSFVRFLVRDDEIGKDSLAAWACVRLDRLREGYRFVHLMDARGVETEGVVLVRVDRRLY
ncbi:PLC-like phosphodiesterase [Triangularia verruculosa]|uniref:Phosphoinositide phospholipase C n=1 Tax=Triangularia verruculosa TaxID=2587418 RepID=A0AAN6XAL1_9PEZI|nr:PLC-like phosphodiesterase [Triangularia verruculosa]